MSGTHGVLQPNKPGYFYITLEESYVVLFKLSAQAWFEDHKSNSNAEEGRSARLAHSVAKAYITDVLENLSNTLYNKTQSEKNLWVFLSFPQLETRLRGACKMRTLKEAMKELIEDGYVFKRPNRDPRYKSLEYRLNLPKYRIELNALPIKDDKDDSANMHDQKHEGCATDDDSANMHDDSANMHDDSANMHDDSANMHPKHNIDLTYTEHTQNTENRGSSHSSSTFDANASTLTAFSSDALMEELKKRGLTLSATEASTKECVPNETVSQQESKGAVKSNDTSPHIAGNAIGNVTQETLIGRPEKPEMPPVSMRWCPEKLVQITEALRIVKDKDGRVENGAYFSTKVSGRSKNSKSPRQRQIDAAAKIINEGVTEEQYISAFIDRNDTWWLDTRGPLTVESMAATQKSTNLMRTLSILEKLESMPAKQQRPASSSSHSVSPQSEDRPVASTPGSQYIVDYIHDVSKKRQRAYDLFEGMGRLDLYQRYLDGEENLYEEYMAVALPVGA